MKKKKKNPSTTTTVADSPQRLGKFDLLVILLMPVFVFGILIATGNLWAGPRTTDDNQIFKLQIEFEESGLGAVLDHEIKSRYELGRVIPVYNIYKVLQSYLFGGNTVIWSVWIGVVGAATLILLYLSLRLLDYNLFESLAFALLTSLGQQSVVWWRLLHGEGIGMLFTAAALVMMALRIRSGKLRYEVGFALMVTLAVLSKESFLLLLPGLFVLKFALSKRVNQLTVKSALMQSLPAFAWLGILGATDAILIRAGGDKPRLNYDGWQGFSLDNFANILSQHVQITHYCVPLICVMIVFLLRVVLSAAPAMVDAEGRPVEQPNQGSQRTSVPQLLSNLWLPIAVWVLISIPQFLLYMNSGMLNNMNEAHFARYILPGILGYAFLIAEILRLIRSTPGGQQVPIAIAYLFVALSMGLKGMTVYKDADFFAETSRQYDEWFKALAENTEPDDPIVLVYQNGMFEGYQTQVALRAYYILSRCYGRQNVYFLPIPDRPTIEEGRLAVKQADTRHHALKMRHASEIPNGTKAAAVGIINWGYTMPVFGARISQFLNIELTRANHDWFHRDEYQLSITPLGYATYYRPKR